ncbi:hypothetical protein AURDEDRAFT_42451, partial [Auricularia subglabra TFB-10046 SS5]
PRLGVQQFVKALCDRHDVRYLRYLRDQFDLAFDVYLAMRRELDLRLKIVLNRSTPNWRVKNSCPACRYKLDGEQELEIPGFFAVDGNSNKSTLAKVDGSRRAKYPLGTFARVMDAGLAPLTGAADIGCALQGTLARSSLGERARASGLRICMNAFHGYGHNRLCQVAQHPLYLKGFGLNDLETIKARSKAIATAVRNYNEAAQELRPPAPTVDFTKLMEWTELQEFDLLRLARRGDVRERAWSQPVNREAATKHYKILRAREELVRCKIEIRRL